ncbi:MAG TPA: chemotaxis protein CheB [Isosphaeraceae bacterium]|nr:chemotaxis protein CheB [Isosphaeraceae bacterium]
MSGRAIIVVGTSTGGVEALRELAGGMSPRLPASVFIVGHFPPAGGSIWPEILSRAGPLLASHPADGDPILPGSIYLRRPARSPPGVRAGPADPPDPRSQGEPLPAGHRPTVPLGGPHYGPRVIGVILTGALYDGIAGLMAIRAAGGMAVAQDPQDARSPPCRGAAPRLQESITSCP